MLTFPPFFAGDVVCVILGCNACMLLRPLHEGQSFAVVGASYVQGLEDASGLLGPLPPDWSVQIHPRDASAMQQQMYANAKTGEQTSQDPRLGAMPPAWRPLDATDREALNLDADGNAYRNEATGEVLEDDPRLLPDALRARGVALETFVLC